MSEERIEEIETKLAYQEDTIQVLNDVVCKQQNQIDQLELTCASLVERMKEMSATTPQGQMGDEPPPPHY